MCPLLARSLNTALASVFAEPFILVNAVPLALIAAFPEVNIELETLGIKLLSPLWQESFDSDGMVSWNKFGDWMKDKGLISESLDVEKSIMK